jgi:hypothetical protein
VDRQFQNKIAQHCIEKFAKKLLGESEIEAVLQRLDRLTQDEGRMTVAQTLEVVHGLVNNVKIVMNGKQSFLCRLQTHNRRIIVLVIDGKVSTDGILRALGNAFSVFSECVLHELTTTIDAMQQMAGDINKMRRSL